MDKIVITKQLLTEMLSADDDTLESYYQAALEDRVVASERPALVAFFISLIIYKSKTLKSQNMNPFHFFGIPENTYQSHMDLLQRTNLEIAFCLIEDIDIPEKAIADFATDYAAFLFWQGKYFNCLGKCSNVICREPDSFLCNFIKASIIEICLINETSDEYKIALINYQKSLIDKCKDEKLNFNKTIFENVRNRINEKYNAMPEELKTLCFDLVPKELSEAQVIIPEWSEEHAFYLQNRLFLNPLCDFDAFAQSTFEDLLPLPVDSDNQAMFDELVADYKLCRSLTYAYCKGINNVGKREMSMVYSYAYSIFDKLAYLIAKVYHLDVKENDIYFSKAKLFDKKIDNTDISFGKIKNINIYPLLCIAQAGRATNNPKNAIQVGTFEINELRNQIDHKSLHLVKEDKLKRNSTILLELAKQAILHTYLLLHGFSEDSNSYDEPAANGTTYMQVLAEIIKENQE